MNYSVCSDESDSSDESDDESGFRSCDECDEAAYDDSGSIDILGGSIDYDGKYFMP